MVATAPARSNSMLYAILCGLIVRREEFDVFVIGVLLLEFLFLLRFIVVFLCLVEIWLSNLVGPVALGKRLARSKP